MKLENLKKKIFLKISKIICFECIVNIHKQTCVCDGQNIIYTKINTF